MKTDCNKHIHETLKLVKDMIILADEGETVCVDDGCVVLYGLIRDCAYRLKAEAENERDRHIRKGIWDNCKHSTDT